MRDGTSKLGFSIFRGVKTFVNDIGTGVALACAVFGRVLMKDDVCSRKCTDRFCGVSEVHADRTRWNLILGGLFGMLFVLKTS